MLPAALDALALDGRIVVLAYQSLEDRIVKRAFAAATDLEHPIRPAGRTARTRSQFALLTRGAERADDAEVQRNPRSAAVRLRAVATCAIEFRRSHEGGPMKAKRPAKPARAGERRGGRAAASGSRGCASRPGARAPQPRPGRKPTAPAREPRTSRSAPQTTPVARRSSDRPAPKSATQAKARAKARKAKAPKVVRPPLRDRLLNKLASIDLRPRTLAAKVPFVVLVIGSLGARTRPHAVAVH